VKFSTQEEYGLRCLLQIARHGDGASVTIPEISQAEGLSESNVAKLLRILRLGGIVDSSRGRVGGYALARPMEQIRLSEVLRVLGGRLVEKDFCDSYTGNEHICVHSVDCTIFSLWQSVQDAVDQVLDTRSLKDLVPADAENGSTMVESSDLINPQPKQSQNDD
jgi:Rrf2 family protein